MDNEIDLREFEEVYQNEDTGAPAIHRGTLLKIVLFACSRGIVSSRRIARECEENVFFMALSGDTRAQFTTIAKFISSMGEKAVKVFTSVLSVCYAQGLIDKKMFAVDGCTISSNCSKERSGTHAELEKNAQRIRAFLRDNEERLGVRVREPVKNNVTDNESAITRRARSNG